MRPISPEKLAALTALRLDPEAGAIAATTVALNRANVIATAANAPGQVRGSAATGFSATNTAGTRVTGTGISVSGAGTITLDAASLSFEAPVSASTPRSAVEFRSGGAITQSSTGTISAPRLTITGAGGTGQAAGVTLDQSNSVSRLKDTARSRHRLKLGGEAGVARNLRHARFFRRGLTP